MLVTENPTTQANTFTVQGDPWSGMLEGNGGNNTLDVVNTSTVGGSVTYTLSDTFLDVTGSITQTLTLGDMQVANLTGASTTSNTFNVSGWSGSGSLTGNSQAANSLIASDAVATFTLTNTILERTGDGNLTLSHIGSAMLTGTSSSTFDVSSWSGTVTLDGEGGDSVFNLVLSGVKPTGTFTVEDTTAAPGDSNTLNISVSANTTVTTNEIKVGTQLVNYSDIQTLNVNGAVSGLIYYVQSLLSTVTATIATMGAANTIDVGSTAGNTTSSPGVLSAIQGPLIIVSGGSDTMNLDDTGDDNGTLYPGGFDFSGTPSGGSLETTSNIALTVSVTTLQTALNSTFGAGTFTATLNSNGSINIAGTTTAPVLTLTQVASTYSLGKFTPGSFTLSGTVSGVVETTASIALSVSVSAVQTALNNAFGSGTFTVTSQSGFLKFTGIFTAPVLTLSSQSPILSGGTLTQATTISTNTATPVTIATLTGLGMGTDGIQYQGISTLNVNLGGPGNTIYLQGNPAITTTTINALSGINDLSIGSKAPAEITESTNPLTLGQSQNTGSVLDDVLGVINYNGSGSDSLNVDDSGSNIGVEAGLFSTQNQTSGVWDSELEFLSASSNYASPSVTINFNGVGYMNIALSQAASKFAVDNTYGFVNPNSATAPVINLDGNTGNDTFPDLQHGIGNEYQRRQR